MRHGFLDHHSGIESPIHHLDARAKIIVFFALVVLEVSTPPQVLLLFGLYAATLVGIGLLARLPVGHLLRKVSVILPFLFFVAVTIPFFKKDGTGGGYSLGIGGLSLSHSGLWVLWNVVVKAFLGMFCIVLLYSTTPFPSLIKGLENLRCPRIFTVVFSFLYRYSFILTDEMQRMRRARDSRGFGGKWLWHAGTIGHMVGTLFLRSFHRGERVYFAMVSRGYEGTMPGVTPGEVGAGEIMFLSLLPALLFMRIWLG